MRKNGLRKLCLFAAAALSLIQTNAQTQDPSAKIERQIKPDPEAGNLGKYGNYNLNLSTGQVGITVPLFTLSGATIQYPISLNYDHKGIPVDERATSAGQNWTVSLMGNISKTVNGLPDEKLSNGFNANYDAIIAGSYSFNYHPLTFNDIYYRAMQGLVDLQADNFTFSFNGRSGKFFFNPEDGQYYTIPYSKLKIEKIPVPNDGYYFLLTDEQGYKYTFDQKAKTSFESTSSGDAFTNETYDGHWYLTRISNPDDITEVELEYIQDNLLLDVNTFSYTKRYLKSIDAPFPGPTCVPTTTSTMSESGGSTTNTTIHYGSLLVSRIKTPFEDLRLVYAPRNDESLRIDSMVLVRKDNTLKQGYKFYHGYYASANKLRLDSIELFDNTGSINKHKFFYNPGNILPINSKGKDHWGYAYTTGSPASLFPKIWYGSQYIGDVDRSPTNVTLNGVLNKIVYPTGGATEFAYELNDYGRVGENTAAANVSTPVLGNGGAQCLRRTTQNGAGTSTCTFTTAIAGVVHFATKRDNCDGNPPNGGQNCTIEPCQTQMTLNGPGVPPNTSLNGAPTVWKEMDMFLAAGTYTITITTFETLDYGKVMATYPTVVEYSYKPKAGGLRIKSIKNYDQFTGYTVRKFSYDDPTEANRSSGIIPAEPLYTYESRYGKDCLGNSAPDCGIFYNYVNLTSQSNTGISFSDGSAVAYTRVLETIGNNGEGGTIDHRFTFHNDNQEEHFPFSTPTDYSWTRGRPSSTLYYNTSNVLVKEEINEYTNALTSSADVRSVKIGSLQNCIYRADGSTLTYAMTHALSMWTYLNKSTTKTYLNGGTQTEETSYFYDNPDHIQLTRTQTTASDGSIKVQRITYPLDYATSASGDAMTSALDQLKHQNRLGVPVSETESVIKGGQEYILGSALTTYKIFPSGRVYPWKSFSLETTAAIPYLNLATSTGTAFSQDSRYHFNAEYRTYNTTGQLSELTDETDRSFSMLYAHNALLPVAYVKNAKLGEVYYNGFEEAPSGAIATAKYGSYGYSGVFTIAGLALVPGTYLKTWWQFDGTDWAYQSETLYHNGIASIQVGNGSIIDEVTIRPQASSIATMSHDPGVGMKAKVGDNGLGTKFEFDGLGRLRYVKDHFDNILKKNDYQYQVAQ
ncbi:hypothetical protein [Taibaiella koreensis]|uniref:hypothetical protein n=1 Tax=Taibaiella koreensis TaxID=1268548 RepID=UPI0013C32D82|nr:hypothetical protein [Taibaiella koreensis]